MKGDWQTTVLVRMVGARVPVALRAVLVAGLAVLAYGCKSADSEQTPTPTAQVQFAQAVAGSLAPIAVSYGTVTSAPAHTRTLVMPFEGSIVAVQVHLGDAVQSNQPIVTIARTPATTIEVAQAKSALTLAQQELERIQRLYDAKLAANDQLASAKKALSDAQVQYEAFSKMGAGEEQTALLAPFAGIVTALAASPGERPAAGTVIATVASPSDTVVQLGIEPAEAANLAIGAAVQLRQSASDEAGIKTRLASVGKFLDPTSRLVNATALLPAAAGAHIAIGTTLYAQIEEPSQKGIVVPRGALLEDAEGPFVFTVQAGKAHRQSVQIGAETDESVLIVSGVAAGTQVIAGGNAALEEGIAVAEAKAPAADADSAPDAVGGKDAAESKP